MWIISRNGTAQRHPDQTKIKRAGKLKERTNIHSITHASRDSIVNQELKSRTINQPTSTRPRPDGRNHLSLAELRRQNRWLGLGLGMEIARRRCDLYTCFYFTSFSATRGHQVIHLKGFGSHNVWNGK